MKVKVKPAQVFDISVDDNEFIGKFTVQSKWEGMVKLVNEKGEILIVNDDSTFIDSMFKDYFGDVKDPEIKKFELVSASPELIAKLQKHL